MLKRFCSRSFGVPRALPFSLIQYERLNCDGMQAIRVQLAPGHVITATLLEFESEMTTQNARITAMHQYNPIYRFMCNEKGIMVHANKLAWEAYSTGKQV